MVFFFFFRLRRFCFCQQASAGVSAGVTKCGRPSSSVVTRCHQASSAAARRRQASAGQLSPGVSRRRQVSAGVGRAAVSRCQQASPGVGGRRQGSCLQSPPGASRCQQRAALGPAAWPAGAPSTGRCAPITSTSSPVPPSSPSLHWCLLACSARWSDLLNLLPQTSHLKGLAPVCLR